MPRPVAISPDLSRQTSERETKTLFGRVTGMLNGIWPNKAPGDRYVPASEALESGLEHLQQDQEQGRG
jgi:hypothetical protein